MGERGVHWLELGLACLVDREERECVNGTRQEQKEEPLCILYFMRKPFSSLDFQPIRPSVLTLPWKNV